MGRPKALVAVGGTTLAERAVAALAPVVERVVLVGRGPLPPALADLERLDDALLAGAGGGGGASSRSIVPPPRVPEGDSPAAAGRLDEAPPAAPGGGWEAEAEAGAGAGPLAGLLAALRSAPGAAWILCPCDLPQVEPAAAAWLAGERRPGRLAVLPRPVPGGPVDPLFALYEPGVLPWVEALTAAGVRAPRELARVPGVAVLTPPEALALCWRDADTPDELVP